MSKVEEPDGPVGFNLNTQKLHCLIVLNDQIGEALSGRAGVAYFRAFVVEDRETGEVVLNQRFRYTHGDSWYRLKLGPDEKKLSRKEQIEYLAGSVEKVMRTGIELMASVPSLKEAVLRFYPPDPDDGQKTIDWLIAQDLVEVREVSVKTPDGRVVPMESE